MSAMLGLFHETFASGMLTLAEDLPRSGGFLGYVGPGAGLSMLGALVAVALVVLLALIGPILYPIRLIHSAVRRRRERMAMGSAAQHPSVHTSPQAPSEVCCGFDNTTPTSN
jgi:hypothetical protein